MQQIRTNHITIYKRQISRIKYYLSTLNMIDYILMNFIYS